MPRGMTTLPFGTLLAALAAMGLAAGPASAHHSAAPFDLQRTVTIEGVVARYHWANPHVYIDVAVAGEADDEVWEVEAAWPASLVPYGWSRETLKVGDRVEVTGNPGRNAAKRIMLGRSLQTAGETWVLNVEPGTPAPDTSLTGRDRSGMPAPEAIAGNWLPLGPAFAFFTAAPPLLTDKGQEALEEGRLSLGDEATEAARCMAHRPPFNMTFQEAKSFEVRRDDIVIRIAVDGDVERIVHMTETSAGDTQGRQGHSIGRWAGDTLVVDTTFDAEDEEDRSIIVGVPLGGDTRLVERFELSADRKRLTYTYTVENPEYLVEPFTQSVDWAFRPEIEIPRLDCDPDIAGRFVAE